MDLMQTAQQPNDQYVISYLGLRKAVGVIGIALPFVLWLGLLLLDGEMARSISAYYWTRLTDVLVGSLCAIAMFMFSYRGPQKLDDWAGNVAGLSALGVALVPTGRIEGFTWQGALHYTFAAVFFATLAFYCLVLFRKTDTRIAPTPEKLKRNTVYAFCGWTIVACMALIPVVSFTPLGDALRWARPVFWLEATAVWMFGLSWLTKGEGILKDR